MPGYAAAAGHCCCLRQWPGYNPVLLFHTHRAGVLCGVRFQAQLWSHPNLSGYIEVDTLIDPVITRDEFTKTRGRDAV